MRNGKWEALVITKVLPPVDSVFICEQPER